MTTAGHSTPPATRDTSCGRRCVCSAVLVVVALVVAIVALATGKPQRAVRCAIESRDGWTIEYPQASVREEEFVDAVRSQTDCVGVMVRYTTSDTTDAGFTVRPIGTRGWFAHGDAVEVWVAAGPGTG